MVCDSEFRENQDKNYACDSLILGTLIKSLRYHGIWPLTEPPYDTISLIRVLNNVHDLRILAVCDDNLFCALAENAPGPQDHRLTKYLKDEADKIEKAADGLDLDSLTMTKTFSGTRSR